jgi:predicted RNase H-like HicB family nuclease
MHCRLIGRAAPTRPRCRAVASRPASASPTPLRCRGALARRSAAVAAARAPRFVERCGPPLEVNAEVLANLLFPAYRLRMKLPVVMHPGEDDWIVVECPLIPGCISQGKTHDEALVNIREAIELCLENRESEGWSLPSEYEVVNVDVNVAA